MIYVKSTKEKVYVENEVQCLARMCKRSLEIFGNTENAFENKFYYVIPNGKPTKKEWDLFKAKVKECYNYNLSDLFVPEYIDLYK